MYRYDNGDDPSLLAFRTMQLELRIQEVYEAYHSFKKVVGGELQPEVHEASAADGEAFVGSLRDRIDLEDTAITGHSFGGATVVSFHISSDR
jgi:platelet-activating factor acetylhydrolase